MRKQPALDVIDGDLPPGVGSIAQRVANLTVTLDGTPEQPEIRPFHDRVLPGISTQS